VTVRLGLSHGSKANDSTGPGPHLDDNRLAEQSRRLIENDATDGVRCTAGGEWADHLECSHRPLLRARRERPRHRPAQQRGALAAFHSITSSAASSRPDGTSRPNALAGCKLMTKLNLVD